jgi:4-hydroxy-tetrahydrodipicolinate reductase
MTVKIGVNGAAGRMGLEIIKLVADDPELELVSAVDRSGHPALGHDLGLLAGLGRELDLVLTDKCSCPVDCYVVYSSPQATIECLHQALKEGVAVVAGTTGLDADQRAEFETAGKKIPVILAANTGVGANLLMKLAGQAARILGAGYDIEVIEAHHNNKKDAPSGTALQLARVAAEARGLDLDDSAVHGRSGHPGARRRDEIGIHAVRAGDIIGEHTVIYATTGERIELTHRVTSRSGFCRGALRAAKFLVKSKPGVYSMSTVLGMD